MRFRTENPNLAREIKLLVKDNVCIKNVDLLEEARKKFPDEYLTSHNISDILLINVDKKALMVSISEYAKHGHNVEQICTLLKSRGVYINRDTLNKILKTHKTSIRTLHNEFKDNKEIVQPKTLVLASPLPSKNYRKIPKTNALPYFEDPIPEENLENVEKDSPPKEITISSWGDVISNHEDIFKNNCKINELVPVSILLPEKVSPPKQEIIEEKKEDPVDSLTEVIEEKKEDPVTVSAEILGSNVSPVISRTQEVITITFEGIVVTININ